MKFIYDAKTEGKNYQSFECESAHSAAMKLLKDGYQLMPGELCCNLSSEKVYVYSAQNQTDAYNIWVKYYV